VPALGELGYTEGKNIAFERKFADGDANKLSELPQELVEHRVDAIEATSTIPIVDIGMVDPR
jgi:putative ABC transport system substrate-binding protein